jgi:hypothetical protein
VLQRCMAIDPARRYPGIEEVLRDFRRIVTRGPRRRTSGVVTVGAGLAVHLEARLAADAAEIDDTALGALAAVLDEARAALAELGLLPVVDAANEQLWVCALPPDAEGAAEVRARTLTAALALHRRVAALGAAAIVASICLHGANVVIRAGGHDGLITGELLSRADWIVRRVDGEVSASRVALAGLDGRFCIDGGTGGDFVCVREPTSAVPGPAVRSRA